MIKWIIPRETAEWVGPVTLSGNLGLGVLELAVLPAGDRPLAGDWDAPMILDTEPGALVAGLTPGSYRLWARVTAAPEAVVFDDLAVICIT